jgi:hypothetical protein
VTDDALATYDAEATELAERYDLPSLLASYQPLENLLVPGAENALALRHGISCVVHTRWFS